MTGDHLAAGGWPRFLLCLLVLCGACGPDAADGGFAVRDSAGVSVSVSTDSVWSPGEGWRLASSPTVQFGTSEAEALFRVRDALFLPDGGVAFANTGTSEVIVLDSLGGLRLRFGGEGEGPGEFQAIRALGMGPGDSLVVFDRGLNRATLYSLDGALGRTVSLPRIQGAPLDDLFPLPDGRFIGSIDDQGRVRNVPGAVLGHARDSAAHMLITPLGDMDDTIAVVSGEQKYYMLSGVNPDFLTSRNPLFRLDAVYTVSSEGTLYAGLGEDFNIGVFPLDGALERIIRDATVDLSLTRAQFDRHVEEYVARAALRGSYPPPGWQYDMPIPDKRPPSEGFLVDDIGSLWVMPHTEDDDYARVWRVFDADGRLLGSVAMPERFTLFAVSGGRVLGRRRTDLDVEVVEVYPLVR